MGLPAANRMLRTFNALRNLDAGSGRRGAEPRDHLTRLARDVGF